MEVFEERYRNSDKEPIHLQILKVQRCQALTYYGQQEKVNAVIRADKQSDGSEGHISDMKHTVLYPLTEATKRAAVKVQADRRAQSSTTITTKRHKPDNGVPKQTKPIRQPQENKGAREERACPYCKVIPAPHRFSQCPMKPSSQAKQAEERVKHVVHIARLSNTSGKVEHITEGEEH
ncbi:hypothetical protein SARC_00619 [Sphaeroforma arctica JP610]|uniref:Uncharacterized protein n=1 Tax=Sphaeroforma arctica JP610 TaxID=667725 RepID=A0A0L0GE39_9EUKA|nr:hypothetical protein SARC_00619 [Sphaeroforma arctica JP610]KNC87292.1 hypothetical protein SARC_00619 [Sphaeroforma arctica JP610]|eukprot:XP_014161194.1 hypothetical protein SARC_00619 [Sphaeroforma arctica JP610]